MTGEAKQSVVDESNYPKAIVADVDRLAQYGSEAQAYTDPSMMEEPMIESGYGSFERQE